MTNTREINERRYLVERDIGEAQTKYEEASANVAQGGGAKARADQEHWRKRLQTLQGSKQDLEAAQAHLEREADHADKVRRHNARQQLHDHARAAAYKISTLASRIDTHAAEIGKALEEFKVLEASTIRRFDEAIQRNPDGSSKVSGSNFYMAYGALLERLRFFGVPIKGLGSTDLPTGVSDSVQQVLRGLIGELDIEARKHGLEIG